MNERKKRGKKQPKKRSDKRIQCPQDKANGRGGVRGHERNIAVDLVGEDQQVSLLRATVRDRHFNVFRNRNMTGIHFSPVMLTDLRIF